MIVHLEEHVWMAIWNLDQDSGDTKIQTQLSFMNAHQAIVVMIKMFDVTKLMNARHIGEVFYVGNVKMAILYQVAQLYVYQCI